MIKLEGKLALDIGALRKAKNEPAQAAAVLLPTIIAIAEAADMQPVDVIATLAAVLLLVSCSQANDRESHIEGMNHLAKVFTADPGKLYDQYLISAAMAEAKGTA